MLIDKLRDEVKKVCDHYRVTTISDNQAGMYGLSINSPANINEDYEIFILDSLGEQDKLQAEAHELGHIYIRENGLVKVGLNGVGIDYRLLELNNALSHRFVIDILHNLFGISSELHLNLRKRELMTVEEDVSLNRWDDEILHSIGLKLYDVGVTIPKLINEVESLAKINVRVDQAYNAAHRYFSLVSPSTPKTEQIDAINSFMKEIKVEHMYVFQ